MKLMIFLALLVLFTVYERVRRKPYLASLVGNTLAALFGYGVYQITYTDLTVYYTETDLFEFRLFGHTFHLVPINATAITFGEVVIVSTKSCRGGCVDAVLKHEFVHVDQYRKMGSLTFFCIYLFYFLRNFFRIYGDCQQKIHQGIYMGVQNCWSLAVHEAYENIPLEIEAREKSGY